MKRTLVRNPSTGVPLVCCWDDCQREGYEEVKEVRREDGKRVHYVFCTLAHRAFWTNAHRSYGNAGSGDRSPLWVPPGARS